MILKKILIAAVLPASVAGTTQCFPDKIYASNCSATCPTGYDMQTPVDVAILGAGMAGVMAAHTIEQNSPSTSYVLLEAKDKIGGKMQKATVSCFGLDEDGRNITVEDGANWIGGGPGNPVFALAQEIGLRIFQQNFYDVKSYKEDGKRLGNFKAELFRYDRIAYECVNEAALALYAEYENGTETMPVPSIKDALDQCGYDLDDTGLGDQVTWWNVDYGAHSSPETTSLANYPEFSYIDFVDSGGIYDEYFVVDQDGYQSIPESVSEGLNQAPIMETEVCKVEYNETGATIKTADCKMYTANKVISTFGNSVMRGRPDLFDPAIDGTENPNDTGDYQKIFYQFNETFWDTNDEFINIVLPPEKRGQCGWFQNLDFSRNGQPQKVGDGMWPGSKILFCLLATDAVAEVGLPITLTDALSFLEPLQNAFRDYQDPVKVYIPDWRSDPFNLGADFWPAGKGFTAHEEFFSTRNGTVYISGAASCLRYDNWVHGAYHGGIRSAFMVLNDMGMGDPNFVSVCDNYDETL